MAYSSIEARRDFSTGGNRSTDLIEFIVKAEEIYRATDNSLENQIAQETGYIMSDAARNAYIEASYSGMSTRSALNHALMASQKAHTDNIAHFGSLKKIYGRSYIIRHRIQWYCS